jgi:hypothetical protein
MSWTEYLGEDGIANPSMSHGIFCSSNDTIRRDICGKPSSKVSTSKNEDESDGGFPGVSQKAERCGL